jgi:hypothetical protein
MNLSDFTLAVPSYNTPEITICFLRSFVQSNPHWQARLILSDNSTDDLTKILLDKHKIPYYSDPGSTHSPSVQKMLDLCQTKYMIHCDTDILFSQSILKLLEVFIQNDLTLMGEKQDSRGGYNLHSRIAPYFCVFDVEKIRQNGCVFHDDSRIDSSGSRGFFNNVPLQINQGQKYYDCGSIIFEDCTKKGLKIGNISGIIQKYVTHFEGMSWRTKSGIDGYIVQGNQVYNAYKKIVDSLGLEKIEIEGKFIDGTK